MRHESVEVGLRITCDRNGNVIALARGVIEETERTGARLDDLRERVAALADRLDVVVPVDHQEVSRSPGPTRDADWRALLDRASAEVAGAPREWTLDGEIGAERVAQIDRLHGTVELRTRLDGVDVIAAVVAATVGTLLDCLVVRIPTGGKWHGSWQRGSELNLMLRRTALRSDSWLAGLAKVPFDRVSDVPIDGFGPRSHRVQTFGHDPLLGLVLGTVDILRGTLTGADPHGRLYVLQTGEPTANVIAALARQFAHLISDVVTPMGLPLPGWTALMAMPVDTPMGEIPAMARWMYLRGYGTWNFLSMASVPAAIEAMLRTYIGTRRLSEEAYSSVWDAEARRGQSESIAYQTRYRAISLLAHGVAAAGNAGKLAAFGGNPLAVNLTEWVMFADRLFASLTTRRDTDALGALVGANRIEIDAGWARLAAEPAIRPTD